ncbi:hypothetical protein V491_09297 [Pseudogymnoascus sp. VKM F-3775]|nr:hypothetical protein V491_09297 [Pseudogymnoascus sp. VKM F-3775]
MTPGELQGHITTQDVLEGISAPLNHVELVLPRKSQPPLSGPSEDGTHDSGKEEMRINIEKYENGRQRDNIEENDSGAGEENQGHASEADDTNQEDENKAEKRDQEDDSEADESNGGRYSDVEGVNQQDSEGIMSNIANMPEFGKIIGFGDRLPHNPHFPLLFSQAALEAFKQDEVKRRIDVIEKYLGIVSQLGDLVKLDIIDFPIDAFSWGSSYTITHKLLVSTDGHSDTLQVITWSVVAIVDHWQKLYDEVRRECDGENISFMDGEKFYFWAIGCLSSFEQCVAETLWELSTFRTEVHGKTPRLKLMTTQQQDEYLQEIYEQKIEGFDQAYRDLNGIHDQLVKKRDEMKVLRDGLFSASGVMESRQSRILGENVQLLAFITIFFLPLAFSASLWSIPSVSDRYPGLTIPSAAAVIIGFITYFIVFNLNLLISGLRRLFSTPRSFLLARMANERDNSKDDFEGDSQDDPVDSPLRNSTSRGSPVSKSVRNSTNKGSAKKRGYSKLPTDWPAKAKAFEVFPRRDEGSRHSNWLLLFYAIRLLVVNFFDLAIGLLKWLRGIIAPSPQNQGPDTEMANYAVPRAE